MSVFAVIILVRIIWWVIQSQTGASEVRIEDARPVENHIPQRPQLGGYGIAAPEEPDAR